MAASAAALYGAGTLARAENIARFFVEEQNKAAPPERPSGSSWSFHHRAARGTRNARAKASLAGRPVCVRLCDGYFFPADNAESGETCSDLCPSASARLYIIPPGPDATIQEAVAVDGEPYSALPDALRYTREITAGCTCHGPNVDYLAMLARDVTLRPGDVVVAADGARVVGRANPSRQTDALASFAEVRNARLRAPAFAAIDRTLAGTRHDGAARSAAPSLHAEGQASGPPSRSGTVHKKVRLIDIDSLWHRSPPEGKDE